jgi:hypothetical protein
MMSKPWIWVNGLRWHAVMPPQADNDTLAERERAMLRFSAYSEPEFFVAPAGMMHAGYVVGTAA